MSILCLTVLIWVTVVTVSHACAPHGVSQPWTKTTNVNNHHHHHTVENIYFDNRTIYNKIVEIEKRIDRIEEMEKMIPLEPEKPKNPLVVNPPVKPPVDPGNPTIHPVEPPKKTDEVTVPEKEEEPEPEPDKEKSEYLRI
ncbi:hypothetical protein GCK72_009149 [Caenorhabditis remanei]|uniref:Uncharacterized protein n=1 Tax=Caenorhabditis remanei TaxID=31234 RepID=A0A6A5H0V4_CAERE|nr:hypothetical protein GCK72_009149 [Caenorhabditis remanei]KAF1760897.1 hypothetical protein GCK72_009149 [Caenorhabditis remanei]